MIETIIKLETPKDVTEFANLSSKCDGDVYVCGKRHIIDGKSLLGLYSLDLSLPLKVEFHGNIPDEVKRNMQKYIMPGGY